MKKEKSKLKNKKEKQKLKIKDKIKNLKIFKEDEKKWHPSVKRWDKC